jgi:hypothetical protein
MLLLIRSRDNLTLLMDRSAPAMHRMRQPHGRYCLLLACLLLTGIACTSYALLQDAGYARAQVVPETEVDTEAHTATATFTLISGTRTTFGHVTIQGRPAGQGANYSAQADLLRRTEQRLRSQ